MPTAKRDTATPAAKGTTKKRAPKVAPVKEPVVPEPSDNGLPVLYDKVDIREFSTASKHGPLTVQKAKVMMKWETEKEFQARMVVENPESRPEHWLFGDDFHCYDANKVKVRCWNNANNRPFDMGWCEGLIHTVLYGQWVGPHTVPGETVNGETVRVSRYGRVLSGQHQDTALILADEILQKARAGQKPDEPSKYPFWDGHDHPFIETIVITGLSEDERVLRTIDYVKPRKVADMLYTMSVFRDKGPKDRNELTQMLAAAIDLLWERTDTKGYKTHPEVVGFLERHQTLLKCVEHLFKENRPAITGGRKISNLRVSAGQASAMCYLMGCSTDVTTDYSDEYRNEQPPCERKLDWGYWDRALDFWTGIAGDRGFIPVREALGRLTDSTPGSAVNQGLGGRMPEKLAIIQKAWDVFKDHPDAAGPPFSRDDLKDGGALCLDYNDLDEHGKKLPDKQVKLADVADFRGIDCPASPTSVRRTRAEASGEPMPAPPSGDDIDRLTEEARARRARTTTGKR